MLIVTPTYNERETIQRLLEAVFGVVPRAHVCVVDDASPDGTGEVVETIAARDPRVRVIHRRAKLGIGTAYIEAFTAHLNGSYRYYVEMDADLSHDPACLPSFLEAFTSGADVVVGSRNIPGGGVEGWGPLRHFVSRGGSLYARLILGVGVRDLTTGYKGYTRQALEAIDLRSVRSNGYSFQVETTYRALRAGLRVVEVPILFLDRRVGQSKMSSAIFAEAIVMMWRLRFGAISGRKPDKPR
ncbi:MAG: polyprenol monophosphomannose synthase [Polyangiaceae bacterium]|nr:polyprenol monophosphomannose synthase [Polyangiaceae bacterium]